MAMQTSEGKLLQKYGPIFTILPRMSLENLNIERESSQLHFAAS